MISIWFISFFAVSVYYSGLHKWPTVRPEVGTTNFTAILMFVIETFPAWKIFVFLTFLPLDSSDHAALCVSVATEATEASGVSGAMLARRKWEKNAKKQK